MRRFVLTALTAAFLLSAAVSQENHENSLGSPGLYREVAANFLRLGFDACIEEYGKGAGVAGDDNAEAARNEMLGHLYFARAQTETAPKARKSAYESALRHYLNAYGLAESLYGKSCAEKIYLCAQIGLVYSFGCVPQKDGEARKFLEEAVKISREALGLDNLSTAKCYIELGKLLVLNSDSALRKEARDAFEKALESVRACYGDSVYGSNAYGGENVKVFDMNEDTAEVYSWLGYVYSLNRDTRDIGIAFHKKALAVYRFIIMEATEIPFIDFLYPDSRSFYSRIMMDAEGLEKQLLLYEDYVENL